MFPHCPYEPHVPPCPLCPPALPVFPCPSLGLSVFPFLVPCYLSRPGVPPCPHSVPSVPARVPRAPAAASAHPPALPHTSRRGTQGGTWQGTLRGTLRGTLPPPAAPVPAAEAAVPGSPASSWGKTGGHEDTQRHPRGNTDIVERHGDNCGDTGTCGGDTGTPMGTSRAHRHMAWGCRDIHGDIHGDTQAPIKDIGTAEGVFKGNNPWEGCGDTLGSHKGHT